MTPERREHIFRIFEQAMDRPLDQRAGFVESAAAGDSEAREQLLKLLRADAQTQAIDLHPEIHSGPVIPAPGDLIKHRYRIEKELGRGGFGVVYLAADPSTPQPPGRIEVPDGRR